MSRTRPDSIRYPGRKVAYRPLHDGDWAVMRLAPAMGSRSSIAVECYERTCSNRRRPLIVTRSVLPS